MKTLINLVWNCCVVLINKFFNAFELPFGVMMDLRYLMRVDMDKEEITMSLALKGQDQFKTGLQTGINPV